METSAPPPQQVRSGSHTALELIAEAARRLAFDRPWLDTRHEHVTFQVLPTPQGPRVEFAIGAPDGHVADTRSYGAYDLYPFPDPPRAA